MNKKRKIIVFLAGALFAVCASGAFAQDIGYTTHIKLIFDQQCAGCHGSNSPEYEDFKKDKEKYSALFKGPRMDTYPHIIYFTAWPDTGSLMRRLDDGKNTKDGKPGNMYQHLGPTEEERQKNLGLFKEWVGNWMLKRWPEITKEEMNGIKVKY